VHFQKINLELQQVQLHFQKINLELQQAQVPPRRRNHLRQKMVVQLKRNLKD